jgi:hypothetical protein
MAETLGSLCDKLTIVKLKQYHSSDPDRLASLMIHQEQLKQEIDDYLSDAVSGKIPPARLMFSSNKVYKKEGNETAEITGSIGKVFSELADANCAVWHVQEKVYEFAKVPAAEKDAVIEQLAKLNLIRTQCVDRIDAQFHQLIVTGNTQR